MVLSSHSFRDSGGLSSDGIPTCSHNCMLPEIPCTLRIPIRAKIWDIDPIRACTSASARCIIDQHKILLTGQMHSKLVHLLAGLKHSPKVTKHWRRFRRTWKTIWRLSAWPFLVSTFFQMMNCWRFLPKHATYKPCNHTCQNVLVSFSNVPSLFPCNWFFRHTTNSKAGFSHSRSFSD